MCSPTRIVVGARVLNEERNIKQFLQGYATWADYVVLDDGGSSDRTLEIASRYPNVIIQHFDIRVSCPQDHTRWNNDENRHHEHLLGKMMELEPNIVVMDDSDCHPNYLLREQSRSIIENLSPQYNSIYCYRLYCWQDWGYFPKMSIPGQSLWAWRPSEIQLHAVGNDPFNMEWKLFGEAKSLKLEPPLVLLHRSWPTWEAYEEKMARYAAWGRPQTPMLESIYAPPEPLPDFAHE